MAKRKSNFIVTIFMLLLLIPASLGIYYAGQYIFPNSNSEPVSENEEVDVYVNAQKITKTEHIHLLETPGEFVIVDFKKANSSDYVDTKIILTKNQEAEDNLLIEDAFDSGQNVRTKITLLTRVQNARIMFSDEDYNFTFLLKIESDFVIVTDIDVPDIIFYS